MRHSVFVSVALITLLASCQAKTSTTQNTDENKDNALVNRVKEAVHREIAIDEIEKFVGKSATINTTREVDRMAVVSARVEIDSSEENGDISTLKELRQLTSEGNVVVYWVRPLKSTNPKVVGVVG